MVEVTRIGMDTSKSVFQLHGVDAAERPVLRRRLRRGEVVKFFASLAPCAVGLEACGGAHHWARVLGELGHAVKLVAPQYAKAYVKRNKNDAADAAAICEAMSRPHMPSVPVKTAAQQAACLLVSERSRLVRERTRLANRLRGLAMEFGVVSGRGLARIPVLLRRLDGEASVPVEARRVFARLGAEYAALEVRLSEAEAELRAWQRQDEACRRLRQVPGIGPIGAALLVLRTPLPGAFGSGRDFAAWMGLTPRDHSSAKKQRLGAISRAGDEALRAVLVSGAMAVIQQVQRGRARPSPWLARLLERKVPKLAAVALANKMARVAWKLMTSGEDYQPERFLAPAPAAAAEAAN